MYFCFGNILPLYLIETTHTMDSIPIVLLCKGELLEVVEAKHKEAQNERRTN